MCPLPSVPAHQNSKAFRREVNSCAAAPCAMTAISNTARAARCASLFGVRSIAAFAPPWPSPMEEIGSAANRTHGAPYSVDDEPVSNVFLYTPRHLVIEIIFHHHPSQSTDRSDHQVHLPLSIHDLSVLDPPGHLALPRPVFFHCHFA